jgi:cytochrome c553
MSHRIPLLFLLLISTVTTARAGDAHAGKALVDKNCYSCHGNEVYTRADRKMKSLSGLKKQVQRCELALGLSWFDDQIDDVAGHLNDNFYKFK